MDKAGLVIVLYSSTPTNYINSALLHVNMFSSVKTRREFKVQRQDKYNKRTTQHKLK